MAAFPFDEGRFDMAREKVFKIGCMEIVVEVCAVTGAFELLTKLIDSVGEKLSPNWIQ